MSVCHTCHGPSFTIIVFGITVSNWKLSCRGRPRRGGIRSRCSSSSSRSPRGSLKDRGRAGIDGRSVGRSCVANSGLLRGSCRLPGLFPGHHHGSQPLAPRCHSRFPRPHHSLLKAFRWTKRPPLPQSSSRAHATETRSRCQRPSGCATLLVGSGSHAAG